MKAMNWKMVNILSKGLFVVTGVAKQK